MDQLSTKNLDNANVVALELSFEGNGGGGVDHASIVGAIPMFGMAFAGGESAGGRQMAERTTHTAKRETAARAHNRAILAHAERGHVRHWMCSCLGCGRPGEPRDRQHNGGGQDEQSTRP